MSTLMPPFPAVTDPAGWTREEILGSDDWLHRLSDGEAEELITAAAGGRSGAAEGSEELPPLPLLQPEIARITHDLGSGPGFRVLRGVPVERLGEHGVARAFMTISRRIGEPMEQPGGVRIAHVRSSPQGKGSSRFPVAGGLPGRRSRPQRRQEFGFRATGELPFHGDLEDVIGFLCVRSARTGGIRKLASAVTVYNVMRQEHPDQLRVLTEPFHMALQFPHPNHGHRWTQLPFLSVRDDVFNACAYRVHIKRAQALPGVPTQTEAQSNALETFNTVAERVSVSIELRPGDMEFFNNHVVLHTRTRFTDDRPGRHLLRVWLSMAGFRTLHEEHPISLRSGIR